MEEQYTVPIKVGGIYTLDVLFIDFFYYLFLKADAELQKNVSLNPYMERAATVLQLKVQN